MDAAGWAAVTAIMTQLAGLIVIHLKNLSQDKKIAELEDDHRKCLADRLLFQEALNLDWPSDPEQLERAMRLFQAHGISCTVEDAVQFIRRRNQNAS